MPLSCCRIRLTNKFQEAVHASELAYPEYSFPIISSFRTLTTVPVNRFVLVIPLILLAACSPTRRVYEVTEVDRPPDVLSDSLEIEVRRARVTYIRPERSTPDVSPQRSVDVISTVLDLSFDFAERTVHGTAEVRIISLSDGLESFYLHAVGMEIHRVESCL